MSIGDGAVTGAGSVITDDVPPGALGIARERQTNIEGYAQRRAEEPAQDAPTRGTTPRGRTPVAEPARADDPQRSR